MNYLVNNRVIKSNTLLEEDNKVIILKKRKIKLLIIENDKNDLYNVIKINTGKIYKNKFKTKGDLIDFYSKFGFKSYNGNIRVKLNNKRSIFKLFLDSFYKLLHNSNTLISFNN